MSTLIPNDFSSYELTPNEEMEGSILTITQSQVLQNQLSNIVAEKLALEFDPSKPEDFIQQESYKRGEMEAVKFILENSLAMQDLRKQLTEDPNQEN